MMGSRGMLRQFGETLEEIRCDIKSFENLLKGAEVTISSIMTITAKKNCLKVSYPDQMCIVQPIDKTLMLAVCRSWV